MDVWEKSIKIVPFDKYIAEVIDMKIALIGYGYWGPNLAKNLYINKNIEFVGICDQNLTKLKKAKEVYGENIFYTTDYKEIMKDNSIDAVAIAVPTEYSYAIAMDALEVCKHVFIEKPIASTMYRAQKLVDKAREKRLIIHCDHIMIYHPVIRYIKNMIDRGELGNLLYIDITRTNLGPIRKDINAMLDLAVHDIAVINYLAGNPDFRELSAMGEVCYGKQETLTFLNIKYDYFIANIKSSWISPIKERRTVVAGTKKMAIFDDVAIDNKLTIYDKGIDVKSTDEYGEYEVHTRLGDIYIPHISNEDALQNSVTHFCECISNHKESLSGPEQSLKVMKVLEQAMKQLHND
jgi:predicted dehydrogenase